MIRKTIISISIILFLTFCTNYSPLLNPDPDELNQKCPDKYKAEFTTSKGVFTIEVNREWAPKGADRFFYLVDNGFYDSVKFFRVLKGFVAQFGVHGDTSVAKVWRNLSFPDDPVKQSNLRGMVTFAAGQQPDSRTTHIFINYGNNSKLDQMRFAPFGKVISGMETIDSLYADYGEGSPFGLGPDQAKIGIEGNKYLESEFPKLDYIIKAVIKE